MNKCESFIVHQWWILIIRIEFCILAKVKKFQKINNESIVEERMLCTLLFAIRLEQNKNLFAAQFYEFSADLFSLRFISFSLFFGYLIFFLALLCYSTFYVSHTHFAVPFFLILAFFPQWPLCVAWCALFYFLKEDIPIFIATSSLLLLCVSKAFRLEFNLWKHSIEYMKMYLYHVAMCSRVHHSCSVRKVLRISYVVVERKKNAKTI